MWKAFVARVAVINENRPPVLRRSRFSDKNRSNRAIEKQQDTRWTRLSTATSEAHLETALWRVITSFPPAGKERDWKTNLPFTWPALGNALQEGFRNRVVLSRRRETTRD